MDMVNLKSHKKINYSCKNLACLPADFSNCLWILNEIIIKQCYESNYILEFTIQLNMHISYIANKLSLTNNLFWEQIC